jgi:hypothetical protein
VSECEHIWWERYFDDLRLATQPENGWCRGCGAYKTDGRITLPFDHKVEPPPDSPEVLGVWLSRRQYRELKARLDSTEAALRRIAEDPRAKRGWTKRVAIEALA